MAVHHDRDGGQRERCPDRAEVDFRTGGTAEAVVDRLLNRDRDDHPTRGGQQRQEEREAQATGELRSHPERAPERDDGTARVGIAPELIDLHRKGAHAADSASEGVWCVAPYAVSTAR